MDVGDVTTLANPEIVERIRIMAQGEAKVATSRSAVNSGVSVIGVDRQGYPVPSPGPDTELFPGDEPLVLGTATQIQHVRCVFRFQPTRTEHVDLLDEIRLESVDVPEKCRLVGNALAELEIPRQTASRS